jgi:DNA polymerase elongation subunit (family B)
MELDLAIKYGYKVTLIEGYTFKTSEVLKQFSSFFIEIKKQAEMKGDIPTRTAAKLCSNSGYGKFGASYKLNKTTIVTNEELLKLIELYEVNSVMDMGEYKIVRHRVIPKDNAQVDPDTLKRAYNFEYKALSGTQTNVALASAITSYGRVMLYEMMIEIEGRGGKMMYTDTDSLFA